MKLLSRCVCVYFPFKKASSSCLTVKGIFTNLSNGQLDPVRTTLCESGFRCKTACAWEAQLLIWRGIFRQVLERCCRQAVEWYECGNMSRNCKSTLTPTAAKTYAELWNCLLCGWLCVPVLMFVKISEGLYLWVLCLGVCAVILNIWFWSHLLRFTPVWFHKLHWITLLWNGTWALFRMPVLVCVCMGRWVSEHSA